MTPTTTATTTTVPVGGQVRVVQASASQDSAGYLVESCTLHDKLQLGDTDRQTDESSRGDATEQRIHGQCSKPVG